MICASDGQREETHTTRSQSCTMMDKYALSVTTQVCMRESSSVLTE